MFTIPISHREVGKLLAKSWAFSASSILHYLRRTTLTFMLSFAIQIGWGKEKTRDPQSCSWANAEMVRSQRFEVAEFVSDHQWDPLWKQRLKEPALSWSASDRSVCKYLPFGIGKMALLCQKRRNPWACCKVKMLRVNDP
jgi:hypothetical protein